MSNPTPTPTPTPTPAERAARDLRRAHHFMRLARLDIKDIRDAFRNGASAPELEDMMHCAIAALEVGMLPHNPGA